MTAGVKHLRFWTLAGSTLLSKKAIVGTGYKMTTMLAVAFGPDDLTASAASSSQIWLWRGRQVRLGTAVLPDILVVSFVVFLVWLSPRGSLPFAHCVSWSVSWRVTPGPLLPCPRMWLAAPGTLSAAPRLVCLGTAAREKGTWRETWRGQPCLCLLICGFVFFGAPRMVA